MIMILLKGLFKSAFSNASCSKLYIFPVFATCLLGLFVSKMYLYSHHSVINKWNLSKVKTFTKESTNECFN